jgi:glycosyltransferase involved in cell wall biosynthesis
MKLGNKTHRKLRVAFLAGTLGQGGAEKQLYYMVRALREVGVTVYVYCLTSGEFYEKKLIEIGCSPIFLGKSSSPPRRLLTILLQTIKDQPHILQSAHFFGNLYITLVGIIRKALIIGAIRNDTIVELKENKFWGHALLKSPTFMISNSSAAKQNAVGIRNKPIAVLPNVIDLVEFTQSISQSQNRTADKVVVVTIARLEKFRNVEDFLIALAISREKNQQITGIVVGDGPERKRLEAISRELNLTSEGVRFLGKRDDIPTILSHADIFALTSRHEGFPNVILEAMAASLPVVTTPAGDAKSVIKDKITGFIIPYNSPEDMAARILELAGSQEMRKEMGIKGRQRVDNQYNFNQLREKLFTIYREFALLRDNQDLLGLING